MVKQALRGAEEAGAEVKFLRTIDLRVDHCNGCGACSSGMRAGKQIKCNIRDDYFIIEEAVLDADAIVVAAPVYALGPTGQYKNFLDRFGPAHDRMAIEAEQEKRDKEGKELLDSRYFKRRFIGYISVGGASTQNWVSYGLAGMHLLGFPTWMKPVGHIDAYNMGHTGNPVLDKDLMDNAFKLGKHTATATLKQNFDNVSWYGDEGICPVCHLNHISVTGTTAVECPLCGITGKLVVNGNEVRIEFPLEQQARARYQRAGLLEHYEEIQGMGTVAGPKIMANKDFIEAELEKLEAYLS